MGISRIWAVNGNEKILGDNMSSIWATTGSNSVWPGDGKVHIFGCRNEIVDFQVIIECTGSDATNVSASISSFTSGGYSIANTSGDATQYVGRNIEVFREHYYSITHTSSYFDTDGAGGQGTFQGQYKPLLTGSYVPDMLIPLEVPSGSYGTGQGGNNFTVYAGRNQALWFDIYIPKTLPSGVYNATIKISGASDIPVQLAVYNTTLSDTNHGKTFFHIEDNIIRRDPSVSASLDKSQNEYWTVLRRYMNVFHRHRIDLIEGQLNTTQVENLKGYFNGNYFTTSYGYDGPGVNDGLKTYSIGTYGFGNTDGYHSDTTTGFTPWNTGSFQSAADSWVAWFAASASNTDYFKYNIDEPPRDRTLNQHVKEVKNWIAASAGVGKTLKVLCTCWMDTDLVGNDGKGYPALDIFCPDGVSKNVAGFHISESGKSSPYYSVSDVRALGSDVGYYGSYRPDFGAQAFMDSPSVDGVAAGWITFKYGVWIYFQWEVGLYSNYTYNPWSQLDVAPSTHAGGDGVYVIAGNDRSHSADYRLDFPITSLRLKNVRRGRQDYELLYALSQSNYPSYSQVMNAVVPAAFDDWSGSYTDHYRQPTYPQNGQEFVNARKSVIELLGGTTGSSGTGSSGTGSSGTGSGGDGTGSYGPRYATYKAWQTDGVTPDSGQTFTIKTLSGALVCTATEPVPGGYAFNWAVTDAWGNIFRNGSLVTNVGMLWLGGVVGTSNLSNNLFRISGSAAITGTLGVSGTITAPQLIGTASFASTASFALNAGPVSESADKVTPGIFANGNFGFPNNLFVFNSLAIGKTTASVSLDVNGSAFLSGSVYLSGATASLIFNTWHGDIIRQTNGPGNADLVDTFIGIQDGINGAGSYDTAKLVIQAGNAGDTFTSPTLHRSLYLNAGNGWESPDSIGGSVYVNPGWNSSIGGPSSLPGNVVLAVSGGYVGIGKEPSTTLDVKGNSSITGTLSIKGNSLFSGSIGSPNYVSQLSGWQINQLGYGDLRKLYVDELKAKAFIADLEQSLAGGQIIAKSVAPLNKKFNVATDTSITVEPFQGFPTVHVFADNDVVRIRRFDTSNHGLVIADFYGNVTWVSNNTSSNPPTQVYDISGINDYSSFGTAPSGTLALDYGNIGDGYIEQTTLDSAGSPYYQIVLMENTASSSPSQWFNMKLRMGNLEGITDTDFGGTLGGYGLYSNNVFLKGNFVVMATASINLPNNGIAIGNIVGSAASALKISQTRNTSTSGLFGYDSVGSEKFAIRTNGTAQIGGFNFTANAITSSNAALVLRSNGDITGSQVLFTGGVIGGWGISSTQINHRSTMSGETAKNIHLSADDPKFHTGLAVDCYYGSSGNANQAKFVAIGALVDNAGGDTHFRGGYGIGIYDGNNVPMFEVTDQSASIAGWKFDTQNIYGNGSGRIATAAQGNTRVELNGSSGSLIFVSASAGVDSAIAIQPYGAVSGYGFVINVSSSISNPVSFTVATNPTLPGSDMSSQMHHQYVQNQFNASSTIVTARLTADPLNKQKPTVLLQYGTTPDKTWSIVVESTGELAIYQGSLDAGSTSTYKRRMHINSGSNSWTAN